jgi:hypothetical protein
MQAAICYLRRSVGPTKFGRCCLALCIEDHAGRRLFEERWFDLAWPPYPNTGRNELMRQMQEQLPPEVEIFVWLDDDMAFEPHEVYAIVDCVDPVERPIVSALYYSRNEEERGRARPVILRRNAQGIMRAVWEYVPGELVPVDAVGMGLCAIHRSKLNEWQAAHGATWFDYMGTGKESPGGFSLEDSAFSKRMQGLGASLWVHTGVKPRHLKTVEIGETQYLAETIVLGPGKN